MTEAAVFDLDDRPIREVREVMTPRPAVVRLDADDPPDEHAARPPGDPPERRLTLSGGRESTNALHHPRASWPAS